MKRRDKLLENLVESKNLCPHNVAKALQTICNQNDEDGLLAIRETYINSLTNEGRCIISASKVVDKNLYFASKLADIVKKDGYEASGQLMGASMNISNMGPVAKFYQKITGYPFQLRLNKKD